MNVVHVPDLAHRFPNGSIVRNIYVDCRPDECMDRLLTSLSVCFPGMMCSIHAMEEAVAHNTRSKNRAVAQGKRRYRIELTLDASAALAFELYCTQRKHVWK